MACAVQTVITIHQADSTVKPKITPYSVSLRLRQLLWRYKLRVSARICHLST